MPLSAKAIAALLLIGWCGWVGGAECTVDSRDYGPKLKHLTTIEKSGAMDAVVVGDRLYFVGYSLYIADISEPASPVVLGVCHFPGTGRQLAVADGIAYVTARANGVYIFDVRGSEPKLLSHYDCIELATGVEVQGNLLLIAQRQYGVEIVDVSDPTKPVYVSKIKTDEAQSVDVRGDVMYVGDWGASQLTTIDIRNPRHPEILNSHRLRGYGDGVCVDGDLLYASTGHHDKSVSTSAQSWNISKDDPGFGAGHGLEIFSIKDPRQPKLLGGVKFPNLYYSQGYDMWSPVSGGDVVVCADTFNGLFLVDVKDPQRPKTIGHYPELVGGVAVVDDIVYAACPKSGLQVLSAPSLVKRVSRDRGTPISLPPQKETAESFRAYRPGGQVWGADFCGAYVVVAAGAAGLRVVKLWPEIREVSHVATDGFAVDVSVAGNYVYVSENTAGLSVWQLDDSGQLSLLSRFESARKKAIRQAMVYADGARAVVQSGQRFLVLDITDPAHPMQIAEHKVSILYGDQMSQGAIDDRFACVWGHNTGIRWLDFAREGEAINTGIDLADRYYFSAGIVPIDKQFLCPTRGGYRLVQALDTELDDKPVFRFGGHFLGRPTVDENVLILTSRLNSKVAIVDIANIEKPRLLTEFLTAGNPNTALVKNGALIIPDGHNGLLIYDDYRPKK